MFGMIQNNCTTPKNHAALAPLPQPGLMLFPGFVAQQADSFLIKATSKHFTREHYIVTSKHSGQTLFDVEQEKSSGDVVFKQAATNTEIMRIKKEESFMGTKVVYKGLLPDGTEKWSLRLKESMWSGERTYLLTVNPFHFPTLELAVQNKVLGEDKGILWNGVPIATMSKHKEFEHIKRRELVCVAPGMDVLLALGIACCRIDKNNKETADMLEVIGGM